MNTQKTVNERIAKVALKNQKVDLAIFDEIQQRVTATNKTFETADKVVDIAQNVNKVLNTLSSDVKFYNRYKDVVIQDLKMHQKELGKLIKDAEQKAKDLGVDLKVASPNYARGKQLLDSLDNEIRMIQNTNLEFDI